MNAETFQTITKVQFELFQLLKDIKDNVQKIGDGIKLNIDEIDIALAKLSKAQGYVDKMAVLDTDNAGDYAGMMQHCKETQDMLLAARLKAKKLKKSC